jgi:hypothetical protein
MFDRPMLLLNIITMPSDWFVVPNLSRQYDIEPSAPWR